MKTMTVETEVKPLPETPEIPVVETERDVFARNRERAVEALRSQGERQITGAIKDGSGGVCFVGCVAEVVE